YRPQQLSLGPLEQEILSLVWELGTATVKDIHDHILADPDRELTYSSVTTVLNRLTKKGWLVCQKQGKAFSWQAALSQAQANAIQSYEQLQQFLAISNPDVVASFANSLDTASVEQLEAIADRLKTLRQQREQ
ncbi:MAG: BlaI/MecI/CopY family transcriptional regulator, partial [Microcystaceae cyanobacterium]